MKYLIPALFLLACNPVKKVLRSPEKTLTVVDFYLQKYPLQSDTFWTKVPGDTVVAIEQKIRTITEINIDTVYKERTYYITKSITDTVIRTIIDKRLQRELQNQNVLLKVQMEEEKKRNDELKKEKNKYKWWLSGVLAVIGLGVFFKIVSIFKPIKL